MVLGVMGDENITDEFEKYFKHYFPHEKKDYGSIAAKNDIRKFWQESARQERERIIDIIMRPSTLLDLETVELIERIENG